MNIRVFLLALPLLISVFALAASAEDYPNKPVTLVAPWGKGGASDIASRLLSAVVPEYLGQGVVVENCTGDGGLKGTAHVHRSNPDGYTLVLARIGSITGPAATGSTLPYTFDDFTMLGLLEINPLACATAPERPYANINDVISDIKERPGQLRYAISGIGNIQHLSVLMLLDIAGVGNPTEAAQYMMFHGGGAGAQATAQGEVNLICNNLVTLLPLIRQGKLKPLLVNSPNRHSFMPDTPTAAEQGFPQLESLAGWSAVFGPPGLPLEVQRKWTAVLQQVKQDRTWTTLTTRVGSIPTILSPKDTRAFVARQFKVLSTLVAQMGMNQ